MCILNPDQSDLLEKSRAVNQAPDERTFHIFYQIMNGMDDEMKEEFLFSAPDKYKFLTCGNLLVAGLNDNQEYEDTREAMEIMGMNQEEQSGERERKKERERDEREEKRGKEKRGEEKREERERE